ncbi:sensor histidine kinase [Leptospira sp. GIMC2001]|uniref:sensor histidine kinase n=1 Tax=Leptospira sp. GIMC2001 TaxID=1513297 RepID=UPI0023495164|nr:PAS domain-containing sensor histidine kinase [Leptospira sp. GIMC2001]WCL47682.1 PAS domain-containing sensor histidine kinase [Leptospira sp. GIMC2001]
MITDRITSLPVALAAKKGFFDNLGNGVNLRSCVDYKSILTLLEAGRIDCAEIPTTTYIYDSFLKKSKIKRLFKGMYLSHSPMSFYARAYFKPYEIAKNKTYTIPVPNALSPERFFTEKFIEQYFTDKIPKLRFVEVPYYLYEKYLRNANTLGTVGDSFFIPFLNKFNSFAMNEMYTLPDLAGQHIPATMLVFNGHFVSKFPKEVDQLLRAVKSGIEFINNCNPERIDMLATEFNLTTHYPHYRLGEFKQLLMRNHLHSEKLFHWRGNTASLGHLMKDHFFRGIKREITPSEVDSIMDFSEIWDSLEATNEFIPNLPTFQSPGAATQYSPSLINYRKQNYTRNLITDAISISLDFLEGNLDSRLNLDDSLRIDNRVRIHMNNMLDYLNSEIFKLNEHIIELENINSILEIKLDRNSVNLQYSEERYRYLFEFSREALFIVDADSGEIIESNLQFRLMTGYSRTDLSRIKIDDLIVGQNIRSSLYFKKDRTDSMLHIPDGEIVLKDGTRLGVDISINSMLVSPKKRYQIILRDNRERLESERAKHEFISNISHELRSPMTNIRGYFELLSDDPNIRSKPENEEMFNIIDKNIKRLSFLIENLLKIEKVNPEPENEAIEIFDPATVIEDVIHMNSHLFNEKKLEIIPTLERGIFIKGIRFEFSQIVSNLFVNAIKYTSQGEIHLDLKTDKDRILFIVKDTGLGIPEKYKNSIFERFFRVPSDANRKIGGTGLGLSITRSLIEKMSGEITIFSEEGKGSTFQVELPKLKQ